MFLALFASAREENDPATIWRVDLDQWPLRHEGKIQEHSKNRQMRHGLKHRCPAGPESNHADKERERQQHPILFADGLLERDRNEGDRRKLSSRCWPAPTQSQVQTGL
jgi:hypothetical protein